MNFRQVEAFRALMICGTASQAAEVLGITQPAVSRAIAELERSVGFALFDRIRGRMVPTPEGKLFFREVEVSFAGVDRLRGAAARIREHGSGEIRIASLSSLGAMLVPWAVARFRKACPEARITLHVGPSGEVRDLVASGRYDIGIAADEIATSGVHHEVFASYPAVCALPPGHRLAGRTSVAPTDLDAEPFISVSPEDTARRKIEASFSDAGAVLRVVLETQFSTTICALVLAGAGVGLVNPMAARGYVEQGLILRPFLPEISFEKLLLFPPDRQKSSLVRHFVKELAAARDRLAGESTGLPERSTAPGNRTP